MISRSILSDVFWIALLVALQIFVLNRMVLLDRYTPVLYPAFVLFYPFFRNKYLFLFQSFLLGLLIDAFLGAWGINALATTFVAYFRTLIFRTSTETSTDFFSFQSLQWNQFLFFLFASIFIHQFFVQSFEFFKFSRILEIFLNILATSFISFIFILIFALAFRVKQKV